MSRANWFRSRAVPGLFALLLAGNALCHDELIPHVAEYKVKISVLGGTMRTQVFDVGDGYMARSVITPTGFASMFMDGSIVEQSEFVDDGNVLRPRHYESIDTLSKDKSTMTFDFDWPQQTVSGVIDDQDFVFPIDGLLHDRVSIQYQLMQNLRNGKDAGQYALLDGDELKRLTVTNIGTRRIKVPFGRFEAIGIQHQADDSSRVSTLWCVRELGYLPIVIEQHKDGKLRVQAVLTDYRELPAASEQTTAEN
ncbi:MAG: DUF3108 domain-containing protein [Woeseia sp.]